MCQTIVHRGPDDEGIGVWGPVGFGMRRLSIIDLAGGHQPIHNEDRTVWVVFNGEIYNFKELRADLEKRGHRFYTNADTETIVHLYEDLGSDCVLKLRGMFAFGLYDAGRQKLLLARDRLGKKPLFYGFSQRGRLLFGSEIKALLSVAPELAEVDPEGLLQFFYFGYIPDPLTAFARIKKLPAGHLLEYAQGQIKVRQYWDVPPYGPHPEMSEDECLEQLEDRLSEAVRIRLMSDVPLGALLSGGVDSSVIVALMARAGTVKTFSVGFPNQDFDELQHARNVAERFGTQHHELIVEPNISTTLDSLTRMLEEPFGDSSMIPTYYVSRMARQHVTVVLSGDGGDELFAGYDRYLVSHERRHFDGIPQWMGRFYREQVYQYLPSGFLGRRFAWNISLPARERYLDSICVLPALHRERNLFSAEFLRWIGQSVDPLRQFQDYYSAAPAADPLSRLLYLDTKTYLAGDILTKVDRMSMATSLEVRVPLLDHVFVEWVTALPSEWKFRPGFQKYIFRKLAERLGVPLTSLHRPKQGFAIPLVHWMRKELRHDLLSMLLEPRTLQRGYFEPGAVRTIINEHLRGRRDRTDALWLLLAFELWHRNFLEAFSNSRCGADRSELCGVRMARGVVTSPLARESAL